MIRLLAIGDVVTPSAADYLSRTLWQYRKQENIDFVIVNGENASFLGGISGDAAEKLLAGGADCITGGNHTLQTRSAFRLLEESEALVRPLNYPDAAPGSGYTILDARGVRILVLSALGCVYMEAGIPDPLPMIERILDREVGRFDLAVLDLHAEATGEKLTVAHALDGRVSAIFGTHTHVPTADEQILPRGTGYISDVGMCGHSGGILGVRSEIMIERSRTHIRTPYAPAEGKIFANAVLFDLDEASGRCLRVTRTTLREI